MPLLPSSHVYSVSGPAPLPKEFIEHIRRYVKGKPAHIVALYAAITSST
jgi:hypothetical protein